MKYIIHSMRFWGKRNKLFYQEENLIISYELLIYFLLENKVVS